jgi:hypothetical protein
MSSEIRSSDHFPVLSVGGMSHLEPSGGKDTLECQKKNGEHLKNLDHVNTQLLITKNNEDESKLSIFFVKPEKFQSKQEK